MYTTVCVPAPVQSSGVPLVAIKRSVRLRSVREGVRGAGLRLLVYEAFLHSGKSLMTTLKASCTSSLRPRRLLVYEAFLSCTQESRGLPHQTLSLTHSLPTPPSPPRTRDSPSLLEEYEALSY